MNKFKSVFSYVKNIKYLAAILLTMIITVQSLFIIDMFFEKKTSYHLDEIYSYGLSNSFYRPYIECDSVSAPVEYNINEWFSAQEYRDYLTVQENQRFRYDSVWYNQSMDRHPPLYYACLHTICSFFPNTFSFLFGFVLNLFFFVIMQIFMYKFGKNLLRSRYAALMMCLVFGFSYFVLSMTIFIRMYLMVTMFLVMLLYYHSKLIKLDSSDIKKWKLFLPVFLVTLAGSLTQYLFLFAAFVLAVCFCLRYLLKKRFKMFFGYGLTMLSGVLVSFAVYPAAIGEIFGEVNGADKKYFHKQLIISFRHLLSGNYGWKSMKIGWFLTVIPAVLFFVIVLSLPVIYLLRDKSRVKNMLNNVRDIPKRIKNTGIKGLFIKIKSSDPMTVFLFFMIVVLVLIISYTVNFLIGFAERYLFIMAPLLCAFLFSLIFSLFRRLRSRNVLISIFTVCMLFTVSQFCYPSYIMTIENDISVHDTVKDKDVLILGVDSVFNNENISLYAYEMYNAKNVFCSSYLKYEDYMEDILSDNHDSEFYVLLSYTSTGQNEKGQFISTDPIGREIEGYVLYVDDILEHFSSKGKCEYVGDYHYALGYYLLYRFV